MIRLLLGFICLMSCAAFGMQVKVVDDNAEVAGVISFSDISRIFVEGDRIAEVKGVKGKYILNKDEKKGDVFVRPTSAESGLIQLYLITEKNKTYQLSLSPEKIGAQTIMLRPNAPEMKVLSERSASIYEDEVVRFVKQTIEGVGVEHEFFRVDVRTLKNKQRAVREKDFYQQGVLAVALENNETDPGKEVRAFVVMANE